MLDYRITVVDDNPALKERLCKTLSSQFYRLDVTEAHCIDELFRIIETEKRPDIILLDPAMCSMSGASILMYLRARLPKVPVFVVSSRTPAITVKYCYQAGAAGFLQCLLPTETLIEALNDIFSRNVQLVGEDLSLSEMDEELSELMSRFSLLTLHQLRVLMFLSEGLMNKQIAYRMGITEATAKVHVSGLLRRLKLVTRTQVVVALHKLDRSIWRSMAH